MFSIQRMKPKEFSFAVELANTMDWHMTTDDFEFNCQLEPDGCLVLLSGKGPIGLATCISYGKVGWFGNLIIQEAHRKHGAGIQLVSYAATYLKEKGAATVGLYAYPYLTSFYGRIGFKQDVDFAVLKAPAISAVEKPDGNIKRVENHQIPDVIDFDKQYFSGCRRKVLEPILSDPDNLCFVACEGENIVGYVAAKVFGKAAEVGPLICEPNQPAVAAKLLQKVLFQLDGKEAYLYVRASDIALLDLAECAGFMEDFRLVRMFLGSAIAQDGVYVAESLERG